MRPQLLLRGISRLLWLLSLPFIRFEFRGGACINDHPAWIMSANHRSVYDFPLAVIGLEHFRWYARIMIASEFWKMPVYGWAVSVIDAIPVYRKTDPVGSLSAAVDALKAGDSVCIMPEGTVHWDPDEPLSMGPGRTGVSRLAVASDVPVMPIALVGTERVWPKGRKVPSFSLRRRTVVCRLSDQPVWLTGDDHRGNARKVKEATEALIQQATDDLRAIDPTYMPQLDG